MRERAKYRFPWATLLVGFVMVLAPSLANALTVTNTATGKDDSVTTSHVITMPTCSTGDAIIAVLSVDAALEDMSASPYFLSISSGSNWNTEGVAQSTGTITSAIYWKIAEGSDNLTIAHATTGKTASWVTYCVSGATGVSAIASTGNSTNSDPPNYATGLLDRNVLWIAAASRDSNVIASAAPSGYSSLVQIQAADVNGVSTDTAYLATTSSTENPGTFTSTTEQWVAWTIAVFEDVTVASETQGPGTLASTGTGIAWTTPSNAGAEDATVTYSDADQESTAILKATNFGFSIPTGAVIAGVNARVVRNVEVSAGKGYAYDTTIQLYVGGTLSGNNIAITDFPGWNSDTNASAYFRAGKQNWGATLDANVINASDFGIGIQAWQDDPGPRQVRVDYIELTVKYFNVFEGSFNFRATSGAETDRSGQTYVLGETSAQTRNGYSFQWDVCGDCARDRAGNSNPEFGGVNKRTNDGTQNTFTVTLPATGYYEIHAAFGDADNTASATYAYFYDDATLITSVETTASPTTANYYLDAEGTTHTEANWLTSEVAVGHTFTSTTFKVVIGSSTNTSGETRLAHLEIISTDVPASGGLEILRRRRE